MAEANVAKVIAMAREVRDAKLHFGRMEATDQKRNLWRADIPAGVSFDATLAPSYFAHYVRTLKPGDDIEVVAEDGAWRGLLWVMFVGQSEVRCEEVWHKSFGTVAEEIVSDTYEVKWRGPVAKWGVVHKADGEVVKDRFPTQPAAHEFLKQHLENLKV